MRFLLALIAVALLLPACRAESAETSLYGPSAAPSTCTTSSLGVGWSTGGCASFSFTGGTSFRLRAHDVSGAPVGLVIDLCSQFSDGGEACWSGMTACGEASVPIAFGSGLRSVFVRMAPLPSCPTTPLGGTLTLTTDGAHPGVDVAA